MLAYMLFNKHTSAPPMISLLQCPVPLSTFASRTNEKQSKKKNSSSAPRLSRSLRPRRRIIGRRPCRRLNTLSSVRACACVCTKKKEKKRKKIGDGTASLHTHSEEGREGREMEGHRANETNNNQRNKKRSGTTLRESLSPRRVTNRSSRSTTFSSASSTSPVKTSSFLTHAYTLVRHRRVGVAGQDVLQVSSLRVTGLRELSGDAR